MVTSKHVLFSCLVFRVLCLLTTSADQRKISTHILYIGTIFPSLQIQTSRTLHQSETYISSQSIWSCLDTNNYIDALFMDLYIALHWDSDRNGIESRLRIQQLGVQYFFYRIRIIETGGAGCPGA